jgi:hypothetical protein
MQPGTSTDVALREVRTVTWLVPSSGVKRSSPTIVWSLAKACTVHEACVVPPEMRTSTRAVAEWASATCHPISCELTFGVASTKAAQASQASAAAATTATAAIVTGRRHPGGPAYLSVSVWSTPPWSHPAAVLDSGPCPSTQATPRRAVPVSG